jgi:DNA-binding transcriptional MocR family regulator
MNRQRIAPGGEVRRHPDAFVQVPRKAMEEWANLMARRPTAGRLLMVLIAQMGPQNAVVVSQKTLAKMLAVSARTVKTAVAELAAERWIQAVRLNGPGTINAYVVNSRVAWAQPRAELRMSLFHAAVIADVEDQDVVTMDVTPLRQIPSMLSGERQLPTGEGLPPPSQPFLEGLEPDLPSKRPTDD